MLSKVVEHSAKRKRSRSFAGLFWGLLAVDLASLLVLLLAVYGIYEALGAFAAGVVMWPLFASLGAGTPSAIAGLGNPKVPPGTGRSIGGLFHGLALVLYLAVIFCLGWSWFHMLHRRFLLPDRFQGEIFVLHVPAGSPAMKSWWRSTYTVPPTGILLTSEPPIEGGERFSDTFYYVQPGGRLRSIPHVGLGTPPSTPESRSDTSHVYYFEEVGSTTNALACHVPDDEIAVGTKASLLSRDATALAAYLAEHPGLCAQH